MKLSTSCTACQILVLRNVHQYVTTCTVKPANTGHSRETERVAIIDRWPLFTGSLTQKLFSRGGGGGGLSGRMGQVTPSIDRWPLTQV